VGARIEALLSLVSLRMFGAGLSLVLAPRGFRRVVKGFLELSDNQLRVIGYVLLGSAASLVAQQAVSRALSSKMDALAKQLPAPAAA
jgi:uncharacterized protein YjeT (DUF2065 family)